MVTMSDIQDAPLDESTSAQPQHFDADGNLIGPRREVVEPGTLAPQADSPDAFDEWDEPASPDGQFHDQEMPTTDGELSRPDPDAGVADRET